MKSKQKLQSSWKSYKVCELGKVVTGKTPPTKNPEYFGDYIQFLTPSDVLDKKFVNITERKLSKQGLDLLKHICLTFGSIAVSCIGSDMGKSVFIKKPTITNQQFNSLIPTDNGDSEFLYYYFCFIKDELKNLAGGGTALPILKKSLFSEIEILIPPKPIRIKIGQILNSIDEQINFLESQNQILEQIIQSLFKSWFIDFDGQTEFIDSELGQIPKGWTIKKLAEICTPQYGYTESSNNEPVGPKFLRITDMNKDPWINWTAVPYCTISDSDLEKYSLKKGDVVVSRMADPGKAGIIEEVIESVFASYLIRLKTSSMEQSYFLFYFLRSKRFLDYVQGESGGGSVQKNMNAQVIINIKFIEPPPQLIRSFFKFVYPIRMTIINNLHKIQTLEKTRDSLLPKLMSGEIRTEF